MEISQQSLEDTHKLLSNVQNSGTRKEMVKLVKFREIMLKFNNLYGVSSCVWEQMGKWIQVGTYIPKVTKYEEHKQNKLSVQKYIKGIVTDSNNIFLWHESEDINKKSLFPKFQLIPSSNLQVMHDYVCFIAPIDYCVK